MKQKTIRLFAVMLSLVMVFSIFAVLPVSSFAAEIAESTEKLNTYDTVSSTLAPGVTQTINQAYRDDGGYVKYFVAEVDLSNPYVGVHATYGGAQCTTPGVSKMTQQVVDMTNLHTNPADPDNYIENYAIVAGVNGDGYNVGTGAPSGAHVMNGVSGFGIVKAGNSPWFAFFEDGTAACGRNNADWDAAVAEHGAVKEAIGGFQLLMKDGNVIEPGTSATQGGSTYWRPGFDYPCSFIGVTAEGKLILMNCNGNGMGGSKGFDYDHTIEVAQELGIKDLLCLDGGGSATYLSRPEGESEVVVTSNPSDGSERAVANGLVIYSTCPPSDVFKSAVLKTDATHYTPNSEIKIAASGVSPAGTPAEIPDDIEWSLSDSSFGTISNGVFTSNGKTGSVKLQMEYDGAVVGSVEVNIVNPTTIDFEQSSMVVPFGKSAYVKMTTNYYDAETGGNYDVVFKASDFTFTFSEENMGSLNGFELTAPTDESKTSVTLNAVYKYASLPEMSIAVSYGKASEIIWDFEDGDVSDWLGWGDAKEWALENAPDSTLGLEASGNEDNQLNGNAPGDNDSYTFLATPGNGHVKNGKYALGFTLDETHYSSGSSSYGDWEYNILFNVEGQTVLRDVANGLNATTVGMWVYVPEDLAGVRYSSDTGYFAMEGQWYCGSSASDVAGYRVRNFVFQDTGIAMSATTDGAYTEVGKWVYMSADISAYDYVSLQNPTGNTYREPSFIRFYFKRLEPKKYTFYFDDFTLDYSSAVEDRDAPVISDPKYVVVDNGVDFGTAASSNKILFTANIADVLKDNTSGLNYNSAKIYVDGMALENVTASGNTMTSEEVTLTAGIHEIIFEIADNMGTVTRNKEMLTVTGNKPIWIAGHNDSGELAEYDSVYYMDLKVADAAAIEAIETEIMLNFANTWELPYLTVAEGFTLEYEFVALTNSVKLTITKNADCALSGEQILVSIPVRIWSWPDGLNKTAQQMSTSGSRPIVPIDFEVEYGFVTYASGNYNGYLGVFYDYFTTETKIQDETYAWHLNHTATAMADVAATCTTAGYTGRTYCDVCKSVVDWGTILPATGHNFEVVDGVLKCSCGELFNGVYTDGKTYTDGVVNAGWINDSYYVDGVALTGVQLVEGFYYNFGENGICAGQTKYTGKFYNDAANGYCYTVNGELQSGWYLVDDIWNFFGSADFLAKTGEYKFVGGACAGITYVFDDEGNLTDGVWHTYDDGNTRYFYGPDYYHWYNNMLQEIDGKTYCFNGEGYLYRGHQIIRIGAFASRMLYHFDEKTGELLKTYETETGVYRVDDETICFLKNGAIQNSLGMITIDGSQYYVRGNGLLAVGKFYIGAGYAGCGHLTPGYYDFGEDGKFVGVWVDTSLNGVLEGDDGKLHYYVNGVVQKGLGMITVDGAQYYVRGNGLVAVGKHYIGVGYAGCGHLTPGYYDFGEDGKFVGPWTE